MFRSNTRIVLGKIESVYGTDPTPVVGTNAIEASSVRVNYDGELLDRNIVGSTLSPTTGVIGQRWVEVSFETDVKWSGTKGTAGRLADFLKACGFDEVISAGSSVLYTPASGTMKSITLYIYDLQDSGSSKLNKITGAMGNVTINLEAGKIAKLGFRFLGVYNAPTDVAVPSNPTFDSTLPPIVESSSLSINSVTTLMAQKIDIDMGNEITKRDDISSAGGLKGFLITSRKPSGSFNPEKVTVATYGYTADWLAQTERALSVVLGSANGNKLTITAPKLSIDKLSDGDRNGILTDEIPFHLNKSSGNDEIQLKFE